MWCLDCSRRKLDNPDADSSSVRDYHEKAFDGERYDKHQRPNHARETLREDCERPGEWICFFRCWSLRVTATNRLSHLRASCRTLSKFQRDWLQFVLIPKCRRWLFEAKRLVNHRVIDVGLVSESEFFHRDDVGRRDFHCEVDGSVQDENYFHGCETLRCVQGATQRHDLFAYRSR